MMLTPEQENIMRAARKGYEAYSNHTGDRSAVTGDLLPTWDKLPGAVCNAWYSAADAIYEYIMTPKK